jgi:hypothetical protein
MIGCSLKCGYIRPRIHNGNGQTHDISRSATHTTMNNEKTSSINTREINNCNMIE